jgi:hypothetical protein
LRAAAVLAAAAGLVMSAAMPAMSAPAPTITIKATSQIKPFAGYVYVAYHDGKYSAAQISGTVTNAVTGGVIRLMAQRFPYNKPAVRAGSKAVTADGKLSYTFTVHPTIATHYTVMLFHSPTAAHATAWSVRKTVYFLPGGSVIPPSKCKRPTCHEVIRIRTLLPASLVREEMPKHWYFYFGIHRTTVPGKIPSAPKTMKLDTKATTPKATRLSASTYRNVIKFSFWVGNEGYYWIWQSCTKDSEAKDGVGLPGHHACGNKQISAKVGYLG